MAHRVIEALGGTIDGKIIAVLGVTFKPNTDDMRDAPSLTIVPMLQERGAKVRVYDPQGRQHGEELLAGVTWSANATDAADGADGLVVITEWNEFRAIDLKSLAKRMRGRILIDLRNIFQSREARAAGLAYIGIGRRPSEAQTA